MLTIHSADFSSVSNHKILAVIHENCGDDHQSLREDGISIGREWSDDDYIVVTFGDKYLHLHNDIVAELNELQAESYLYSAMADRENGYHEDADEYIAKARDLCPTIEQNNLYQEVLALDFRQSCPF